MENQNNTPNINQGGTTINNNLDKIAIWRQYGTIILSIYLFVSSIISIVSVFNLMKPLNQMINFYNLFFSGCICASEFEQTKESAFKLLGVLKQDVGKGLFFIFLGSINFVHSDIVGQFAGQVQAFVGLIILITTAIMNCMGTNKETQQPSFENRDPINHF